MYRDCSLYGYAAVHRSLNLVLVVSVFALLFLALFVHYTGLKQHCVFDR